MTQLCLTFVPLQKKVKKSKEIKVINTLLVIVVSKIHSTPNNFFKQLLHVYNKSLIIIDIQTKQCIVIFPLHADYIVVCIWNLHGVTIRLPILIRLEV